MSDIFAEVDEDLRADRAQAMLKKYGGVLVGAALVVVVGVGAWQAWRSYQTKETARVAAIFLDANRAAAAKTPAEHDLALAEFAKIAGEGSAGYRSLARIREAGMRYDAGERDAALALFDKVAADSGADPLLRDFAALQWVWHQIDSGPPAALRARLAPLTAPGNAWRPLAEEAQALIDIREGHKDAARDTLKRLSQDKDAPDGVRGRASGLLDRLGS